MISGRPTQSTFRFVHDRYSERVSDTGEVGKGLRKKDALGHDKLTNTNGSVRKSLNKNGGIHDFMNNTK